MLQVAGLKPKEYGSEYHWMEFGESIDSACFDQGSLLFSTGRSALVSLLRHGMRDFQWKKVWMPQYFCPEVTRAVRDTGINVGYYFDSPLDTPAIPADLGAGAVIFINNHFGLRNRSHYAAFYGVGVPIIEDHSHDPWSNWAKTSSADFAIASYRKVLPIPDGAGLWSPRGNALCRCEGGETARISEKLRAMLLKAAYLTGGWPEKEDYLTLYRHYAESLGSNCFRISGLSRNMLTAFPWEPWREQRKRNFGALQKNLPENDRMLVMKPDDDSCVPYSFVLVFDTPARRERVRQALFHQDIYPAVLWPITQSFQGQIEDAVIRLSERMLSIHIDGRYTEEDMRVIAAVVRRLFDQ